MRGVGSQRVTSRANLDQGRRCRWLRRWNAWRQARAASVRNASRLAMLPGMAWPFSKP